jgi:hypothetical protein
MERHVDSRNLLCALYPLTHRDFLEKVIVAQQVKEFAAFLWNMEVSYPLSKSPPLIAILRNVNLAHIITLSSR